MFVLSPLHYLENQASDLLATIAEMSEPPRMDNNNSLAKVHICDFITTLLIEVFLHRQT